ncbi:type I secretion system permease/ATPase [Aliihoeflea sp. 2WW]|uniref:type I secretion system permease/ATPase n=1 Tax=Aliihoeflea sp. 2WW TaxID=1381123 RepID=UPI00046396A5|nr:type I secretion system permease/ATPase [Aliihoeflea sp. 2WW]
MHDGSQIGDLLARCRRAILPLVLFTAGINVLMLTSAVYMLQIYDRVLSSHSLETLAALTAIALVALMTMAALEAVRSRILVKVGTWLGRRLAPLVLRSAVAEEAGGQRTRSTSALRDAEQLRAFLSGPAVTPLLDAPWAPIFLAVIFLIHPILGFFACAGAVLLFALAICAELLTRRAIDHAATGQRLMYGQAENVLRNAEAIEAMGMLNGFLRRWQREVDTASNAHERAGNRAGYIQSIARFLRFCLQVGILGLGAWLVLRQEILPGAMVAASIILGRAMAPVEQAIGAVKSVQTTRAAYRRLKTLGEVTPPAREHLPLPRPEGRLRVEHLVIRLPGANRAILDNVSFRLEPGESLGIVGSTASGKSSLARALVGAWRPTLGAVRLDNMDVAQWAAGDRGKYVGYLPQDVELVGNTVGEAIARLDDVADPAVASAVIAAARLANLHETIKALPKGYETEIGDGGVYLSGGQRQRIGFARALYGAPALIVLDEPNANLDREGEEALVETIAALKAQACTMVIVAHRPRILETVDHLLVLEQGRMELFGPRPEVLARLAMAAQPVPSIVRAQAVRGRRGPLAAMSEG